jgi:DNA-nicking Smr family endonuclease
MSRKPAAMKVANLEDGMPRVEEARLRLEHELHTARGQGVAAVKIIHGYGSSGIGGALRTAIQAALRLAVRDGKVASFITGEDWRVSDTATWELLKRYPEFKRDSDLGRSNPGISIVVL